MTLEHLCVRSAAKPWGRRELRPWAQSDDATVIGELWYERSGPDWDASALLLKLLFTSEALSIQVHPDNAAAQAAGMNNGKTEAWYVLSAEDGAKVGIGLNKPVSAKELRDAIADGSIGDLINWQNASAGDAFFVPAGTIHAIGAALVIAEIQQTSDTTYRLFDYGRARELHIEQAVSVARLGPAPCQEPYRHLTMERTILVSCDFFVLEQLTLPANARWELKAESECWFLVLAGEASVGSLQLKLGDAVFAQAEDAVIRVGDHPITVLIAYAGNEARHGLLRDMGLPAHLGCRHEDHISTTSGRSSVPFNGGAVMSQTRKIAFVGNSLPRRCGIATFTTDLQQAVSKTSENVETAIVAMTDHGHVYNYPHSVHLQIADDDLAEYVAAAKYLNAEKFDVVCLQHEFGIFGGDDGSHILALLSRLTMPVVTTLHTVLAEPTPSQRRVFNNIIDISSKVVVMAKRGRELLQQVYDVPAEKIEFVPHGIPEIAFSEPDEAKKKLGFEDRSVILTFGLLSPNKGIEVMIDAMPVILQSKPDAVYVVLGATHPNLVRTQGETYRQSLVARAKDLGIEDHVVFLDRFVDLPTLLDFISMCDVYATPYLNEAQMTSGTLAYSFGLGKAVVSTPYWHASELLADGSGVLVPFGDSEAIGREIAALLTDDEGRNAIRRRAYAASRSMTWQRTGQRYLSLFDAVIQPKIRPGAIPPAGRKPSGLGLPSLPQPQFAHFLSMCDDTGLFQHAVHSVPDRSHGYCVDDNARALLLSVTLMASGETLLPDILTTRFASFVQHAWNPDEKHFRNFMGFDRRWLEDKGSEDSHGRTLWALGQCALNDTSSARRSWAADLFAEALPTSSEFTSPRAWAFTLLGLDGYCAARSHDISARRVRSDLADRLMELFAQVATPDRSWFEEGLSYDNARLPQALILAGLASEKLPYISVGLQSLRWLMTIQTARQGHFRPVGSDGFGDVGLPPQHFDQQPVEAAATISACLTAWHAEKRPEWQANARIALDWFMGANDLAQPLVDIETGSCRDGLHRARPNENRGAESVLAYLLGLVEYRRIVRSGSQSAAVSKLHALSA